MKGEIKPCTSKTAEICSGAYLILIAVVIAYWGNLTLGLALAAFVGVMTLQSVFTDWCPVDLVLKPMGLKKKLDK